MSILPKEAPIMRVRHTKGNPRANARRGKTELVQTASLLVFSCFDLQLAEAKLGLHDAADFQIRTLRQMPRASPFASSAGRKSSQDIHSKSTHIDTNAPAKADLEKALGLRIRALRQGRGLSVTALASAACMSIGMISKIENGRISASLSTIQSIATALDITFTSLFSSFEDKRDCSYVSKGAGRTLKARGTRAGHIYSLLGALPCCDLVIEPYLIELKSDATSYSSFRHKGVEFIHLLAGELVYRHADKDFRLKPGDSMLFDAAALHGPENLSSPLISYLSLVIYLRRSNRRTM